MHVADRLDAEVLADPVGAQRQRQAGVLEPPLARVDDQFQPLVGVGQLPFVDDQPGIDAPPFILPGRHGVENPVEGDDHVVEIDAQAEPQGEIGGGSQPGHGNRGAGQLVERHARRATTIGPYRSPMLAPHEQRM